MCSLSHLFFHPLSISPAPCFLIRSPFFLFLSLYPSLSALCTLPFPSSLFSLTLARTATFLFHSGPRIPVPALYATDTSASAKTPATFCFVPLFAYTYTSLYGAACSPMAKFSRNPLPVWHCPGRRSEQACRRARRPTFGLRCPPKTNQFGMCVPGGRFAQQRFPFS